MTTEPCGCKHNGQEWTFMCEACTAEFKERHERAQAEKSARERFKEIM